MFALAVFKKINIVFLSSPLFVALVLWSLNANAASPVSNVGGTVVDKGVISSEFRFGYTEDDVTSSSNKRFRMRQHIDHGFNDWYAFRLLVAQDKRRNDNLEHQSFTVENRFQLIEARDYGWDGGFRLSYSHSDGDKTPHELEVRLVAETDIAEKWNFRHNTVIEHDVGADSEDGASVELRHRFIRKMDTDIPYVKSWKLGVDMFNDLGRLRDLSGYDNQDHQIGPVASFAFDHGFAIQTTYRAGISSESVDNTFGLFLKKKF